MKALITASRLSAMVAFCSSIWSGCIFNTLRLHPWKSTYESQISASTDAVYAPVVGTACACLLTTANKVRKSSAMKSVKTSTTVLVSSSIDAYKLNFMACKCRVKCIRSIGCHKDFNISSGIETIKLINDFEHSSLDLTISISKSCTTDCIDFIEENNA